MKVNVEGNETPQFCRRQINQTFYLISSVAVYGYKNNDAADGNMKKITEDEACFPKGEYAISRLKAEELAVKICRENDIALTILRLATVIGEGDRGNVSRLIEAIDKKRFVMIGKGGKLQNIDL